MKNVIVGAPQAIQKRQVARIFVHKLFDSKTRKNDIALIKLDVTWQLSHTK